MKKITNIFYFLIIGLLFIVASLSSLSVIKVPFNFKVFSVVSGSMSPAIKINSLVITKQQPTYGTGQVITFLVKNGADQRNSRNIITHRIVGGGRKEDGTIEFITRGDANNTNDLNTVNEAEILGAVIGVIPLIGSIIHFAKTQNGFIFLVVIPSTIIVWTELISIKNETKKLLSERKKRKLSLLEKTELAIGEEEIKLEKESKSWFKKLLLKFLKKK